MLGQIVSVGLPIAGIFGFSLRGFVSPPSPPSVSPLCGTSSLPDR